MGLYLNRTDKVVEAHTFGLSGTHDDHFGKATISPDFASSSAVEREYTVSVSNQRATTSHRIHIVSVDIPPEGTGGSKFNVISVTDPAGWTSVLGDSPFGSGVRTNTITWTTTATTSRINAVLSQEFKFKATGPPTVTTYAFVVTLQDDGLNEKTDAESDPSTLDDDGSSTTKMFVGVENVAPTVTSITIEDINRDGKVDSATVVFSEEIDDSTLIPADWKIGGKTVFSIDTNATSSVDATTGADDRTVRFSLKTTDEISGTDVQDVTHTSGSSATTSAADLGGNKLGAVVTADVTELDGAHPQINTIESNSTSTITVTFSEKITGVVKGDWTVVASVIATAATTSDAVVVLTLEAARQPSATSSVSYVVGSVKDTGPDEKGNNAFRQEDAPTNQVATDKVAPTVTKGTTTAAVVVASVQLTKTTSAIDVTFSEWIAGDITNLTVDKDDWAVNGNTVTAVATTTGGPGENTTFRLTLGSELASNATSTVTYSGGSNLKDFPGNAVVDFSTTTVDKIGSQLLSVTWKDITGDGTLNATDTIRFIFDEEMDTSTISGTGTALDGDLVVGGKSWGSGHTLVWGAGTTTLTVTLAGTPTVVAGDSVDPAGADVKDIAGNTDITGSGTGEDAPTVVQVSLTLNPDNTSRNKNQVVNVTVDIEDVENLDALAFTVTFASANIQFDSATAGTIAATTIPVSAIFTATGSVRISQNVAGTSGVTGSGTLVTLKFTWIGNSGTSSALTLGTVSLSDKNSVAITANTTNTTISSPSLPGDGNGDGTLNVADQTAVERIVAGLDSVTPGSNANETGGATPNAQDITCTERLVAGNTCP